MNHHLPRWLATTTVFIIFLALMAAFVAAAIPPLSQQATQLIHQAPQYIQQAQSHSSTIGKLNDRFHIQQRITDTVNGSGGSILNEIVTAGSAAFAALADVLIVIVLTVYFLIDFPRIRATLYRLVPQTRRPRAILIGDEMFAKVGAYVLGNVAISAIAAAATAVRRPPSVCRIRCCSASSSGSSIWCRSWSTIAGVVVAAVALTVSLPVCISTAVFFVVFRGHSKTICGLRTTARGARVGHRGGSSRRRRVTRHCCIGGHPHCRRSAVDRARGAVPGASTTPCRPRPLCRPRRA
ncbi:AI-2E family transporter [Mycolicibacterium aubagnense]